MIDRRTSLSRVLSLLGLGFATLTALDGCGAGQVGAAVRPKEATAGEGIGEGPCREADTGGEPLVVDRKPEQRGDLELLMKENVAIVSYSCKYSCKGFKLLEDCKVDGTYGFLGMSRKVVEASCPKGLVMAEGKCTEPKSVAAFLCNPNNAPSASSTAKNFEKGCNDADALACGMLGMAYKSGDGVSKDDAKAASLLQKGCEGGNDAACGTYGKMLLDGTGTANDPNKAKVFLRRPCDGTQAQACIDAGNILEASRDVIGAKIMYQRGCWRGNMQACFDNGRMELNFGGQKDAAKRAFEMGCMRNDKMSWAAMKVLYGGTRAVFPGPETMDASRRCDMGGSPRDCGVAGLVNIAAGNPMGQSQIERACMQQDGLACAVKAAKK